MISFCSTELQNSSVTTTTGLGWASTKTRISQGSGSKVAHCVEVGLTGWPAAEVAHGASRSGAQRCAPAHTLTSVGPLERGPSYSQGMERWVGDGSVVMACVERT